MSKKEIYLDNNGTTIMCSDACKEMRRWDKFPINPSGMSKHSIESRRIIERDIKYFEKHCNTNGKYKIIFTSGGSESNSLIIRSVVDGWSSKIDIIPHMVISSIEHVSILSCTKALVKLGRLEVTYINPNIYGIIEPEDIAESIKPNTCLVCVMMTNNEIGQLIQSNKLLKLSMKKEYHCTVMLFNSLVKID